MANEPGKMRLRFKHYAEPDVVFAHDAWDNSIGEHFVYRGRIATYGKLLEAKVAPDGRSVDFCIEVPTSSAGLR